MTRSPRHQNIRDRTDRFLPIAERLASLIRTKKNVKVPRARLKAWANDCRLLEEEDGVVFHRQRRVLRAYEPIYGGEYVPVVECGMTWRKKFLRVEEAIGRRKNGNGSRRPGGARRDPRSDPYPTGTRINYSEDPS